MTTVSSLNANGFNFRELRYEPCTVTVRNADGVTVKEGLRSSLRANGIEEDDTYARSVASTGSREKYIAFLNSLTEEELDKTAMIGLDRKTVVGTYREKRELAVTEWDLFKHSIQVGLNIDDMSNRDDPFVVEYHKLESLRLAVFRNEEGALARAKAYLQGLREPQDTITLSGDVNTKTVSLTPKGKVSIGKSVVERNMEDALALAKSFQQASRAPKDTITLSADAVKILYSDTQETPPSRLDI